MTALWYILFWFQTKEPRPLLKGGDRGEGMYV